MKNSTPRCWKVAVSCWGRSKNTRPAGEHRLRQSCSRSHSATRDRLQPPAASLSACVQLLLEDGCRVIGLLVKHAALWSSNCKV